MPDYSVDQELVQSGEGSLTFLARTPFLDNFRVADDTARNLPDANRSSTCNEFITNNPTVLLQLIWRQSP
jgi:hypothetical protein